MIAQVRRQGRTMVKTDSRTASSDHVWVNGRLEPAGGYHLSVSDRGFQFGDGVYETARSVGGRVVELAEHVARLRHSADALDIPLPADVDTVLAGGIRELLKADGLDAEGVSASIRVTVSRGATNDRTLLPAAPVPPTIVVQACRISSSPSAGGSTKGIHVIASSVRHDPRDPMATIKTTSRGPSIFARVEARRAGADDAIFLTTDGHLAEATQASLFFVRRGAEGPELCTPSLDCGILEGTTRTWILRWAERSGLRPVEGWFTADDLAGADEAFICASVVGVVPVVRFNGKPIGTGEPGSWTLRGRDDREAHARGGR
jgi:branched-subunit amino acid aminotransferase/4-amino-4-deoxychorismate lyase